MQLQGIAPLLLVGIIAGVAVLALASYGGYRYYSTTQGEIASTTANNHSLSDELARSRADNEELSSRLATELARNGSFESQINDIASTVGTLTKLSQTDKELLQKYSRVYFLNENYLPSSLSVIDPAYTLDPTRTYRIHSKVQSYLEKMLADAQDDGAAMFVLSAYRSFGEQAALKVSYKLTYGAGANAFSADQGYSEHQLGTAVDLTTKTLGTTSLTFGSTTAGIWLNENAYKYGFILSYPKGNAYYQYEPWHWRFVGVDLATRLHQDNEHFYDLTQRDIDTYLISIFD